MTRKAPHGLFLALLVGAGPAWAATQHQRHAHASRQHFHHAKRSHAGAPYVSQVSPTPTCRYSNGTPYDPDIIGGANHVGDGGPAVNLGGFNPCGY